ncbi:hypothetical protein EYF80_036115 [Liparis tanakae]|uniref:Uncharacterized protein n=1 Tax=Liparis tanakae TaxID=230148 RepID=A0A4Z2GK84_9TELE|nr:hypothetical protein EYF80_036115 [Liparis tanakae]
MKGTRSLSSSFIRQLKELNRFQQTRRVAQLLWTLRVAGIRVNLSTSPLPPGQRDAQNDPMAVTEAQINILKVIVAAPFFSSCYFKPSSLGVPWEEIAISNPQSLRLKISQSSQSREFKEAEENEPEKQRTSFKN